MPTSIWSTSEAWLRNPAPSVPALSGCLYIAVLCYVD
jgi:hypothetical protein